MPLSRAMEDCRSPNLHANRRTTDACRVFSLSSWVGLLLEEGGGKCCQEGNAQSGWLVIWWCGDGLGGVDTHKAFPHQPPYFPQAPILFFLFILGRFIYGYGNHHQSWEGNVCLDGAGSAPPPINWESHSLVCCMFLHSSVYFCH